MDKNLNNTVCLLLSSASERIKQLDTWGPRDMTIC
jgi:hypothetical protein